MEGLGGRWDGSWDLRGKLVAGFWRIPRGILDHKHGMQCFEFPIKIRWASRAKEETEFFLEFVSELFCGKQEASVDIFMMTALRFAQESLS